MNPFLGILIAIAAFALMEFMAWFTHRFIMHGFMWYFHKDHHQKEEGWFERNDVFFLIYATPGVILILSGIASNFDSKFFTGIGISMYGFAYFLVHDIFIHQRFKVFRDASHPYFLALRKAHKAHHKSLRKEEGTSFGMLIVPKKYYLDARKVFFK